MRHHHTGSRPHVQGSRGPRRVRHSARNLTDGGGLVLVRKLFDRFGLAGWIDGRANREKGFYPPGLMTEVWIALLLYVGGVIDDLPLLERRGVRRIFGWTRVPDPTTVGRWLRLATLASAGAKQPGLPRRPELKNKRDKPVETEEGRLELDTYDVVRQTDVLTNIPAVHALTAWHRYNDGAVVEQRTRELAQLSAGKTAVDDLGGNALFWSLAVVADQALHTLRQHLLSGSWRMAQPKRLRLWLLRLPAKLTTHGRKNYLQLLRGEPIRLRLLAALRGLNHDIPPPVPA